MWKDVKKMVPWPEMPQRSSWHKQTLSLLSPTIKTSSRENKVAYLDGVRGFAAFIVYCIHHIAFSHGPPERRLNHSFGFRNEYWFADLPIIRLFISGGGFAVALFFVISGYALSVSPLTLMHTQRPGEALRLCTQLGCSFPRRWIRLYLPVIITTFLFMTTWCGPHTACSCRIVLTTFRHVFNIQSSRVAPTATYAQEFAKWLNEFREGSYVWLQSDIPAFGHNDYNHHMWSIAVEYRGSAIVYVTTLAYFALGYGPAARFWASTGLFCYFHFVVDGPYYALFIIGMLLCDLDLTWDMCPEQLPKLFKSEVLQKHRWITYIILLVGLYLGGCPMLGNASDLKPEPGWYFLAFLVPYTSSNVRWYYCVWSAVFCMFAIPRIHWLKRLFESNMFQYLGKISFAFYLVHGPIMWTVGDRVYAAVGRPSARAEQTVPGWTNIFPLSDRGPLGLEINALAPHIILLPLTLWLAVIVTKLVDTPSMKLSKKLFPSRDQKPRASETETEKEPMLPSYTDQVRT